MASPPLKHEGARSGRTRARGRQCCRKGFSSIRSAALSVSGKAMS